MEKKKLDKYHDVDRDLYDLIPFIWETTGAVLWDHLPPNSANILGQLGRRDAAMEMTAPTTHMPILC